jgi:dipeptidyl aminopeptidase/acylaminoacyl peptidase
VGIGTLTDAAVGDQGPRLRGGWADHGELLAALDADFDGRETLRHACEQDAPLRQRRRPRRRHHAPHVRVLLRAIDGRPNARGGTHRINLLPTTCHVYFGSVMGATPTAAGPARPSPRASHRCRAPTERADRGDQVRGQDGSRPHRRHAAQPEAHAQLLDGEHGIDKFVHLVRGYFRMDGHHIQFNVVTADTLREAQADPDARDLIVRVAGYSDYFCDPPGPPGRDHRPHRAPGHLTPTRAEPLHWRHSRHHRRSAMLTIAAIAVVALLLIAFAAPVAKAGEPHPFNVHDLIAMDRLSDPQASPDGRRICFAVSRLDLDKNKRVNDLHLIDADGSNHRRLTTHPSGSSSGKWSPDGTHLFFLSSRSGSSQVWRIPVDGGEAQQATDLPLDVGAFKISPDGTRLCVALDVFPGTTIDETRKRLDEEKDRKASGQLYDKLFVRHWDTWKDGRRSHLFIVAIADNVGASRASDLMESMDADCPGKPFGGDEDFTFTPDAMGIVFACRNAGREEAWSTAHDLYLVPTNAAASPEVIASGNGAFLTNPVFSPDGRTLSWLAMVRPGFEADRLRIMLMDWPDGKPRSLTEAWDRSPGSITWGNDSKTIYTHAQHLGQLPLFAIDAATGDATQLTEQGKVTGETVAGNRVVFGLCHLESPVELHSISPDGANLTHLTAINARRLEAIQFGEAEQFTFKGWNDETVHCYIVKPVGFVPTKKYPVAFLIHGGPQGSFGNDFHYRWNPQIYAAAGYATIMVDFHGSTGYGQDFTDAIRNNWGRVPFEDLQKGLAAAIDRCPWMNPDKVGALGASFGGYMINWIAGNWPDRFKCLVNHDGNIDERMAYYDTEELWFPEWERTGTPWENPEAYNEHNPIDHVDKWKTPMLVIHGQLDYRVVDTQGISTFTALQRRNIPSKFLYFPDENHWVLKPHNSIQWHETVLAWLDKWL